jgi:hypothetical protein
MKTSIKLDFATGKAEVIEQRKGEPPVRSSEIVGPTPDCCDEWTRSAGRIEHLNLVVAPDDYYSSWHKFLFCPWCGRARPNDRGQAQTPDIEKEMKL